MSDTEESKAIAVVRRCIEEVQVRGDFDLYDELFDDNFVDHTPQPGVSPDKAGVKILYSTLRDSFAGFGADIHWQVADGDLVTTFKHYHGTHTKPFLGIEPTGRKVRFEAIDAMRVVDGRIVAHWGVGNLYSLASQLGGIPESGQSI